jgi:FMN-dependent NADH-azoreductase
MNRILMIEVSPRGKDSASRSVADTLAARITDLYPSAKLIRRDLAAEHLPHLDEITLRAISTRHPDEAEWFKEAARKSDQLTDELLESDLLVMATPMWNFGIPSALKAWIDLVGRRTRRPYWFWLRVAFLQRAHGAPGILSSLTCVKS